MAAQLIRIKLSASGSDRSSISLSTAPSFRYASFLLLLPMTWSLMLLTALSLPEDSGACSLSSKSPGESFFTMCATMICCRTTAPTLQEMVAPSADSLLLATA